MELSPSISMWLGMDLKTNQFQEAFRLNLGASKEDHSQAIHPQLWVFGRVFGGTDLPGEFHRVNLLDGKISKVEMLKQWRLLDFGNKIS